MNPGKTTEEIRGRAEQTEPSRQTRNLSVRSAVPQVMRLPEERMEENEGFSQSVTHAVDRQEEERRDGPERRKEERAAAAFRDNRKCREISCICKVTS